MAVSYTCDGCGATVENPVKVGKVLQREYCEACAVKANEFVATEEALRKRTQQTFIEGRAALIAQHEGFRLPDVP